MKTRSLALVFLPVLALLGACTVVVSHSGTDVRFEGRWTVNGGVANSKSCETVGLDSLALVIYSGPTGNSGRYTVYDGPCAVGSFFTDWEFAADVYYYEWIGYDNGVEFLRTERAPLDATAGGTHEIVHHFEIDLPPPAAPATGIYAPFTVMGGQEANATNCAIAGIDWVQMVILDTAESSEWAYPELQAFCEDGFIETPTTLLDAGDYKYLFRAYDMNDELIFETPPPSFDLRDSAVGTDNYFEAPTVDLDPGISIYATMRYETGPSSGFYSNCIGAGADTTLFMWDLYADDPRVVADPQGLYYDGTDEGFYCNDQIVIEDFDWILAPGYTYYLQVRSTNEIGPKWGGTCEIHVDHAGYTDVACDVDA